VSQCSMERRLIGLVDVRRREAVLRACPIGPPEALCEVVFRKDLEGVWSHHRSSEVLELPTQDDGAAALRDQLACDCDRIGDVGGIRFRDAVTKCLGGGAGVYVDEVIGFDKRSGVRGNRSLLFVMLIP